MKRDLICSSYTIAGVMPGEARASRHEFADRARACAAAGYRGMSVHFRDYAEQRRAGLSDERLRLALSDNGLVAGDIEFLSDWFLDGAEAKIARANEAAAFAAAEALGAKAINVGGDLGGRGVAAGAMRDRFAALCERAERRGLCVALEIVAWGNVATIAQAMAIIDGLANARLALDCWHLARGGVALSDLAATPGALVSCVQINDAPAVPAAPLPEDTRRRLPCGEGALDIIGFLRAIEAMGVHAPISVEIINADLNALSAEDAARLSFRGASEVLARA